MLSIDLPDGYSARLYSGSRDFAAIADVFNASAQTGGDLWVATADDIESQFSHTPGLDPEKGILFIEFGGEVVAYCVTRTHTELAGTRIYRHVAKERPEHLRRGLGSAMLAWAQGHLIEVSRGHDDADKQFQTDVDDHDLGSVALIVGAGYKPVGHSASMVRPHLDDIPTRSLPAGVEVRPVLEEHLRAIWEADSEAFRDHQGAVEPDEEYWVRFNEEPHRDISLWKVAWHGDEVVGQVRSFINQDGNVQFDRLRGYTEDISTASAWRGQGVAGALICASLRELKERGMSEAALSVHVENATGAYSLYQSLGFEVVTSGATYQCRVPQPERSVT